MTSNGNFAGAVRQLCEKARKSLGRLKRTLFSDIVDIRLHLDFFDKLIAPIFLYGCEIWGAYTISQLKCIGRDDISGYFRTEFEKLHLSFLKYTLGVNSKASNIAVLSELGAYPYSLKIMKSVCKNWHRIRNSDSREILYDAYKCNVELLASNNSTWLNNIKTTMSLISCNDIWNNDGDEYGEFSHNLIEKLLKEKFILQWQNDFLKQAYPDKKLRTYSKFKSDFKIEKYLIVLKNLNERKNLTRLRISAHNLNIEKGRHRRPVKVPIDETICDSCLEVEDEIHYVVNCQKFREARNRLFDTLSKFIVDFDHLSSENKFMKLMKCDEIEIIWQFTKFISETVKIRGTL